MSNLKYTIDFVNPMTGAERQVVVDFVEFTPQELEWVWQGPGDFKGPVAWAVAWRHANARMAKAQGFIGLGVKVHRVQ
jgi:hypothetical protein